MNDTQPLTEPTSSDIMNGTFSIQDTPVAPETSRVIPQDVASGVERGTKTIMNTDGSYVTLGLVPDGSNDFGIAFFDAKNNLISKSTGSTDFKYDLTTGKNYYQNGKLPDGSYGAIFVKSGVNVSDVVI